LVIYVGCLYHVVCGAVVFILDVFLILQEIRDATNKARVLGENRFKQQVEQQTGRRAVPLARGGDRKSKFFRAIV
jgi:hypothetical protein